MAKPNLQPLKPTQLTPYEGQTVTAVALEVSNTGYGLGQSMAMEPVELHHGDVVTLVFRCTVDKVRYDRADRDNAGAGLIRAQVLRADEAFLLDSEIVAEALAEHRRKLDEAAGTPQISGFPAGAVGDSGTPADDSWEDPVPLRPLTDNEKEAADAGASDAD